MPSISYRRWIKTAAAKLDQIEDAHASVGGKDRGRRFATDQINQAYAILLASQFQGFCRDLHSESAQYLTDVMQPASMRPIIWAELTRDRKLDKGNAHPGNLGSDFKRLGVELWDEASRVDPKSSAGNHALEKLNEWRNAIAHQDFNPARLGTAKLRLAHVRQWRAACNRLARAFDRVMRMHIHSLTGPAPWQ